MKFDRSLVTYNAIIETLKIKRHRDCYDECNKSEIFVLYWDRDCWGRDEILFLGNRGLIIKSSSDSITVRFQRWYSFTTDFHSRFPPLRNIFLGGGGPSPPVYSQFTTPRWKRWHEFTVQFSILFLPSPFSTLCSSFAAVPSSLSIIYYFETS